MTTFSDALKARDAETKAAADLVFKVLDAMYLDRMWLYTVPVSGRQPVIAATASESEREAG